MTTLRLLPLLCLLAATATCRHEFPGDGDRSVADRGADRPADLLASDRNPDAPRDTRLGDGPADGPHADEGKLDGPKPDASKEDKPKVDAPKVDASKSDKPKADAPKPDAKKDTAGAVTCAGTPAGDCFMKLLCGADGKFHVDCAKCGCLAGGTCTNGQCKVSLTSTADSFTRKTAPSANFGAQTTVELSKYGSWEQETAYLDFPVQSSIPSVATITSAQLKLYVVNWGGRAVDAEIRLVGQAWGETTINHSNAPAVLTAGPWSKETIGWGWNVLNVTPHIALWLGAPSTVHGLRVEVVDTSRPRPGNCYSDGGSQMCGYSVAPKSREHSVAVERPVIEVTYQ